MKTNRKFIVAIDFDDTIVFGKFPQIAGFKRGAKKYINKLHSQGVYIIINTCRSKKVLFDAKLYLDQHGIKYDSINENEPDNITLFKTDPRKIYAHRYIDDKNLFGFPGWWVAYNLIRYYKWRKNR